MSSDFACETNPMRKSGPPTHLQSSADRCTDRYLGADLVPYQLHMLEEHEEAAFEAHLLDCDFCFETLRSLDESAAELLTLVAEPIGEDLN